MDTAVPVAGTRRYNRLKELNATYEYLDIPGADHSITGIPEIYGFFSGRFCVSRPRQREGLLLSQSQPAIIVRRQRPLVDRQAFC
jgi:hypothetical protein